MSDSFKVLNHFLRNIDKTLKILSNRKGDNLRSSVERSLKSSLNNKKLNPVNLKEIDNILKTENATKQIENVQLILFSLGKYLEYLTGLNKTSCQKNSVIDYVRNNLDVKTIQRNVQSIQTRPKEFLNDNLNLKNLNANVSSVIQNQINDQQKEQITKEQVAKEQVAKEQIIKEQVAKEQITKEQVFKEPKLERLEPKREIDHEPINDQKKRNFVPLGEQKLSERSKATKVPATRLGRIVSYGELAAGLGIGTIVELSKRQFGLTDSTANPIFTEANANRIVKTLCKVRGAALKIGQILSIQDLISPELQRIFERVRQSADYMPEYQLKRVLNDQLGSEWESNFKEFDLKPFAAASIGQVHRAVLKDGREVALKIQYPGVAEGIDSDLKNLVSLLKVWNVLPPGLFIDSVIKVTKKELSWELDYERETEMCKQYAQLIEGHLKKENFRVPKVIDNLSTKKIITSEMMFGLPVDKLDPNEYDQQTRNDVSERLLNLLLYEIFIFKFMQTDPNWSNFFFNPNTNEISLIDFGATRSFSSEFVAKYYKILKAAAHKNEDEILKHSINIGFLTGLENKQMIKAHVDSVLILGKVFEHDDLYDFGRQDITLRIHRTVPVMVENRLIPPPDEIYSLHRKLSGVFMLLVKLKANVNCRRLFNTVADLYEKNEKLVK